MFTALPLVAFAPPVSAQTAQSNGEQGSAGPITTTAKTTDADAPESAMGDIVVTANKREQNLNKVGQTISALSGEQLANQRVATVADLATVVPGLTFAPSPNATPVYTLRGVGFFESSLAAYPNVSLYLDQVPLSLPVLSLLTAFDLERVEVLKGPQGTLFGNNSTGGAINFVAAKPTKFFGAGVEIGYGRFGTLESSGFITGPLSTSINARASFKVVSGGDWQKSYTRTAASVPDSSTAKRQDTLGQAKNIAGRVILDWTPDDRFKASLNVNGWRDQDDPPAPQYTKPVPALPPGTSGPAGTVPANLPILVYRPAPLNARAADWSPDHRPFADHRFWQISLRADYKLSDDLSVTSITGYSHLDFLNATESDGTALSTLDIDPERGKIRSFTQELRLSNDPLSKLRFTLGANYEHTTADERNALYIRDTTAAAAFGFTGNLYGSDQRMSNYAVFGNIEYDVSRLVTLKGGIRQTRAKRFAHEIPPHEEFGYFPGGAFGPASQTAFFNAIYAAVFGGRVPPIMVGNSIALDTRVNADGSPVNPATYLKTGDPDGSLNEDSTSWSGGVDLKPMPGLLIYANVSRGYKAGSFPTIGGAIYDAFAPVTQEKLTDYEGGVKLQLFDRKLSINAAAFYYDYRDKQLRAKFIDPIFGSLDHLVNVPKSKVTGAELNITAFPTDGLALSSSATYLNAEVTRYTGTVGSATNPTTGLNQGVLASFEGVQLPFAPKWQFAARADYRFPLTGRLNGYVGVGVTGQSRSIGILTTSAQERTDYVINARALIDLAAGVTTADGRWRIGIWGKNVGNKYYWTQANLAYDNIVRYPGRPAEYGVTAALKL